MTNTIRRVYAAGGVLGLAVLLIIIVSIARADGGGHASGIVLTVPRDALEDTALTFVATGKAKGELELAVVPAGRDCREAVGISPSGPADGEFQLRGETELPDPGRHELCLLRTDGAGTAVVARRAFTVRAARATVAVSAPSSMNGNDSYSLVATGRTDTTAELVLVHSRRKEACDPIDPQPTASEIEETFTIERGAFRKDTSVGWLRSGSASACASDREGGPGSRVLALARRSVLVTQS